MPVLQGGKQRNCPGCCRVKVAEQRASSIPFAWDLTCLNTSFAGRTLPLKGCSIWRSFRDVLHTLKHLTRDVSDTWYPEGSANPKPSYPLGTGSGGAGICARSCCSLPGMARPKQIPLGTQEGRQSLQLCHPPSSLRALAPHPAAATQRGRGLQRWLLPGQEQLWLGAAGSAPALQAPRLCRRNRKNVTQKPTGTRAYVKIEFVQLHIPASLV